MSHARLRHLAHRFYGVPGTNKLARVLARLAVLHLPLSVQDKQRVYNFVAADTAPQKPLKCRTRVPGDGSVWLELHLGDGRDDLDKMVYYFGYQGYERGTTALMLALLREYACVVDVGANIDDYSLMAASLLEGRGQGHAFEPWAEVCNRLARNASLNKFSSLHLNQAAASDSDGVERLYIPENEAWTMASLVPGVHDQSGFREVRTTRLDTYCRAHSVPRVELLKIDAEGGDLKVLRGMGTLVQTWQPDVICEVLPPFAEEIEQFFHGTQYRKFLIGERELMESDRLRADPRYKDYYFTCRERLPSVQW